MTLARTYQLIEEALGGGGEAYGELLERIRPRIVLWSASRIPASLKAKVDAEDLAQEVLLAVHKGLPDFRGDGERSFFAWVFQIARYRLRDLFDYHGALKRKVTEPLSFTQTTPTRGAARVEAALRLRRALADLPEDYRLVIQLRKIEERSFAEVAEIMERGSGAVRMLYLRAMKALAAIVRDAGGWGVTGAATSRPEG